MSNCERCGGKGRAPDGPLQEVNEGQKRLDKALEALEEAADNGYLKAQRVLNELTQEG